MLPLITRTCIAVAFTWSAGPGAPLPALDPTLGLPEERAALTLTDEALATRVKTDVGSLGSMSFGQPNRGQLLGGVNLQNSRGIEVVAPESSWGTAETVGYLEKAIKRVQAEHPGTLPLHIGHLSRPQGGHLSPHRSHQSGRDVDVGFYYAKDRAWYRRATDKNLDLARTWSLVRAFITETDVEMIIVDYSVQRLLRAYAEKLGEDRAWLNLLFQGDASHPKLIRHLWGHTTHMHVRFFNPGAQTLAQRAYPHLLEAALVTPVKSVTLHKAKKGETLGKLAKRYGSSVRAIQLANGLRGTTIQAKRLYTIPRANGPAAPDASFELPPRRLPPRPPSAAVR